MRSGAQEYTRTIVELTQKTSKFCLNQGLYERCHSNGSDHTILGLDEIHFPHSSGSRTMSSIGGSIFASLLTQKLSALEKLQRSLFDVRIYRWFAPIWATHRFVLPLPQSCVAEDFLLPCLWLVPSEPYSSLTTVLLIPGNAATFLQPYPCNALHRFGANVNLQHLAQSSEPT